MCYLILQNEDMQQQIIKETFQLVSKRDDNVCNFLEGGSLIGGSDYKLIYRHYATLYFVFCVDSSESELGILDLIQVFVETLDKCFENVCELDLIFHVDKVHYILNELVMGGMVLETNMTEILTRIEDQNKLEKQEVSPIPCQESFFFVIETIQSLSKSEYRIWQAHLVLSLFPLKSVTLRPSLKNYNWPRFLQALLMID